MKSVKCCAKDVSPLGKEQVDKMSFSSDAELVNEWLMQVREFRRLMEEVEDFPFNISMT